MRAVSLNCPNCGAPLHLTQAQPRTLCLYCGSTVRVDGGAAPAGQVTFELPPEVHAELMQLVVDGRQVEAIQLYRQRTGVTEAEALQTLNSLLQDLTRRTVVRQPTSNVGLLFFIGVDSLLSVLLIWAILNANWVVFGLALAIMLLHSLAFAAGVIARVRYELGEVAPALVRKFARLGELKLRGQPEPVQIVRLWLEVRPTGRPAVLVEKNVAMRKASFDDLQAGLLIEVRYNQSGYVFPTLPMTVLGRQPVDAEA